MGLFSDPVIRTKDGKENYRVDKLLEENGIEVKSMDREYLLGLIKKNKIKAPNGKELGDKIESYSLMMKTSVAGQDASLRPRNSNSNLPSFPKVVELLQKKLPLPSIK